MSLRDLENHKKELENSLIFTDNLIMKKLEERTTYIQDIAIINYQIIQKRGK